MYASSQQKRLIPAEVEYRAQTSPGKTYAFLPKGKNLEDGFFKLSNWDLDKAVNACALWLDEVLGGKVSGSDHPTIPYIGADDFRYAILYIAVIKTRRQFMTPVLYNTTEASVKLLEASRCTIVMASEGYEHYWQSSLQEMKELRLIKVPPITEFIHDRPVERYPYTKSYEDGLNDPMLVLQTSGTTGNAKPLRYDGRALEYLMTVNDSSTSKDKSVTWLLEEAYIPNLLPLSWGAGLQMTATFPLTYGHTPIMLPSSVPHPVTASFLKDVVTYVPKGEKNGLYTTPDVLRELAKEPESLDMFRTYDWAVYVGAPLDHPTGELISQYTRVQSMMGSTDAGIYPFMLNDPKDWKIHRFHPSLHGYHFEHFQGDLYELCIKRQPSDSRPPFAVDPTLDVYHTKDLWKQVQERKGFWRTAGRVDDFVKLASLTKFNAIEFELLIDQSPYVDTAFVAGDARKRPFAIIQPRADIAETQEETMLRIWPTIAQANEHVSAEARLTKDLVLLTKADFPIKRTGKGTVDRRSTLKLYGDQIEDMYVAAGFERLPAGTNGSV